jgi:hypothetical protein
MSRIETQFEGCVRVVIERIRGEFFKHQRFAKGKDERRMALPLGDASKIIKDEFESDKSPGIINLLIYAIQRRGKKSRNQFFFPLARRNWLIIPDYRCRTGPY